MRTLRLVVECTMFALAALVGLVGGHTLWWLMCAL